MKLKALAAAMAIAMCLGSPAKAQESLAKHIDYFSGVDVRFVGATDKCGIKDKDRYSKKLGDSLQATGIRPDPLAIPHAYLFVQAVAFGPLSQQCAVFLGMRLGTDVKAAAARLEARLEDDKVLIDNFKMVEGVFPAAFFYVTLLFVELKPSTPDRVEAEIDRLVAQFDKARNS